MTADRSEILTVRTKRVIVLVLAMTIAGVAAYAWWAGVASGQVMWLSVGGVALAVIYVTRGGSLPEIVHEGLDIQKEDDPRNIRPAVYLPIILAACVAAALLIAWTRSR